MGMTMGFCFIVLTVFAMVQAENAINCGAAVLNAARGVVYACENAHAARDWCNRSTTDCAFLVSGAVNDLGYAITEASKVEQDCHGEHTECGQDLGSLVRGVAQIVPEAWIAAEACKKEKFVNCALYSMLSGLSSLEAAQGVEYSLRSCIHKHDGPSKFDCLADAAGSVHGLVTTVGAVISSAKWCKSGQEECGEEVCTTFMNVGYTAVKISQVLHTCRGKNTACAEELGFVVPSLGQAGLNLISARQACKKLDASCVATLVLSAGAVLDFASKASSAIRNCHKGNSSVHETDLKRARTRRPRSIYRGANHTDMLSVLNGWLKRKEVNWKECGDWSIAELRDFIRLMHKLRNSDFDDIYLANSDNRAIYKDVENQWSALDKAHDVDPNADDLKNVDRDGLCHEAVMLYVHHLTAEVQSSLVLRNTSVPLLPHKRHLPSEYPSTLSAEMTFDLYQKKIVCANCHLALKPVVV